LPLGGFETTGHGEVIDRDVGNAALTQRLLKLAIGHDFGLVRVLPDDLQPHQQHERQQPVTNIPGLFFVQFAPFKRYRLKPLDYAFHLRPK
jgi:hypothetical protein